MSNQLSKSTARDGRLEVIRGCMFAGKTQGLIARLRTAQRDGLAVKAFKHRIDDRYDATHLITHNQDRFDADRAVDADDISRKSDGADVVGIDEGHFFGTRLLVVVKQMVAEGKHVIIAGIDNDAWGRPFPPMPELAAMADEDVLICRPCTKCGRDARFSQRMVPVTTEFMVGGVGEYEPRCADCFTPLPGPPPEQP